MNDKELKKLAIKSGKKIKGEDKTVQDKIEVKKLNMSQHCQPNRK